MGVASPPLHPTSSAFLSFTSYNCGVISYFTDPTQTNLAMITTAHAENWNAEREKDEEANWKKQNVTVLAQINWNNII